MAALFVVYKFSTGQWVGRERLDEKDERIAEKDRRIDELSDLLDKALGGNESISRAMDERNRLERAIVDRGGGSALSAGLTAAENTIRRPRPKRIGS